MKSKFLLIILFFFQTSVFGFTKANDSTSHINAEMDFYQLEGITVTATRNSKLSIEVPVAVNLLRKKDYLKKNQANLMEMLNNISGIMVQKTSHGQTSPFLRGFTGFRTLVLIDGIRLNNSVFREGPNQYASTIDFLPLDRIEIAKGQGSALYGTDAIGGVINVIYQNYKPNSSVKKWQGNTYFRYSSAENSKISRFQLNSLPTEKIIGQLGVTFKKFGELDAGGDVGLQKNSGFNEVDYDFNLTWNPNNKSQIDFNHQSVAQDDIWRTHKTIYGFSWEGTSVGTDKRYVFDQKRRLTYIQFQGIELNRFLNKLNFSISYQNHKEDVDRMRSNDSYQYKGFDLNTIGLLSKAVTESKFGLLTYGFDFYQDKVNSYSIRYNSDSSVNRIDIQGPVGDDATYTTADVYFQHEFKPLAKLNLFSALRFTNLYADAPKVIDPLNSVQRIFVKNSTKKLIKSLRFVYHLKANNLNLYGGISEGYRAPNLSDLTRFDAARSNEIEVAAPDLYPENFLSYEVGLKSNYKNIFIAQTSLFYTSINNMIIRVPTGEIIDDEFVVTKKNSGEGYMSGVEIDIEMMIKSQLKLKSNFSWYDGEINTYPTSAPILISEPIDRLTPVMYNLSLAYEFNDKSSIVELSLNGSGRQNKLSTRDKSDSQRIPPGGTPGYYIISFNSFKNFNDYVSISLGIENIFDKQYRIHGSGINGPGRNLIAAVNLYF